MSSDAPVLSQPASWLSEAANNGDWTQSMRGEPADLAGRMPLPDRHQEAWRYTPVRFLQEQQFFPASAQRFGALQLTDIDDLLLPPNGDV